MDCSSITAPAKFSRRFGRDYKQLDSLTQASLYCRDLGKVKVDCRLRVSQSKWGVLGGSHTPAATLYMDFTFLQPPGCRLSDATITVTLQPVETASGKEGVSCTKQCLAESSASNHLQMTDYYGPKHLCGEPVSRSATKTCRFTPHISAFDSGVGGVGVDSEESVMHTSRWTFTGALLPAVVDRNSTEPAAYRTLRWELAENELDLQPKHVNTIQTGFTLEHNGSDFYMVIAVQGKLLRKSDRLKGRLGRLRFPRENEGTSVTKINPGSSVPLESRLDPIAHGLSREMERRNLVETPVQIPEALSATFCDASSIPHGGTFGSPMTCTDCKAPVDVHQLHQEPISAGSLDASVGKGMSVTGGDLVNRRLAKEKEEARELERDIVRISQFPALLMLMQLLIRVLEIIKGAPKPRVLVAPVVESRRPGKRTGDIRGEK